MDEMTEQGCSRSHFVKWWWKTSRRIVYTVSRHTRCEKPSCL